VAAARRVSAVCSLATAVAASRLGEHGNVVSGAVCCHRADGQWSLRGQVYPACEPANAPRCVFDLELPPMSSPTYPGARGRIGLRLLPRPPFQWAVATPRTSARPTTATPGWPASAPAPRGLPSLRARIQPYIAEDRTWSIAVKARRSSLRGCRDPGYSPCLGFAQHPKNTNDLTS
jgi:hypothetical protein